LNTRPPRLSEQARDGGQVEQQNKEPQNHEVMTSIFPPEADSIFCSLKSFIEKDFLLVKGEDC